MAYNSATRKVMYHQTSGAGAPADWEYDAAADTWTKLSGGAGAASDQVLAYDAANARLVGWSLNNSSGYPEMWLGTLSSTSTANRCDINGDGTIDAIDVQMTINQTLGACGNADLNGDGPCNVIDIQRVINASLGGACVTSR
jgi:hypothetical protein